MKKIFFIIFTTLIILLPIKTLASSNTSNLDIPIQTDTSILGWNTPWYQFNWLYQTSNTYIYETFCQEYDNFLIYIDTYNHNSSTRIISIKIYNSNNSYIQNYYRSSGGLYARMEYVMPTNWRSYSITIYFNRTNQKYYSDINFTNEISSIENLSYTTTSGSNNTLSVWESSSSTSSPEYFNVYNTNVKINNSQYGTSYNRTITLRNTQDNNSIYDTFTVGDDMPSFVSINYGLPSYLNGYKKITLTTEDKYIMLSDIQSGSIFIPSSSFFEYGGRLSYYDNDINIQSYLSYIQDYTKMPDGLFIRQDFDLSSFTGADWVMFSKYLYLEGEDNISYDIWVPNSSYDSNVVITPNNLGGNDFDFTYKDSEGNIQNGQVQSEDLSLQNQSPLLGNIFEDFSSNTFGLTSIITAPLSLINSLSTSTCTDLDIPLPFINSTLTLPCMTNIYQSTFGTFFILYQTITFGIISYWVIVKIWNLVKDFKNPDHDEIEVLDL